MPAADPNSPDALFRALASGRLDPQRARDLWLDPRPAVGGLALLHDVAAIFRDHPGEDAIPTPVVRDALIAMPVRPWGFWQQGGPISFVLLARMLQGFGIHPRGHGPGDRRHFLRDQVEAAQRSYLADRAGETR